MSGMTYKGRGVGDQKPLLLASQKGARGSWVSSRLCRCALRLKVNDAEMRGGQ